MSNRDSDKEKILELLPVRNSHPIVEMAWVAIEEGAEPNRVVENMMGLLVEELNRYRPESGQHTHNHTYLGASPYQHRPW